MNRKCSNWLWNCKNKKECEVIYENTWRNEMSFSDSVLNHWGTTQASSCEILLAVRLHVDTTFVTGRLLPQELPRALKVLSRHLQTTAQAVWMRISVHSFISSGLFTNKRSIFFIWEWGSWQRHFSSPSSKLDTPNRNAGFEQKGA